ncbi:hypothetical protein [Enterobacter roggenkampii]|uniref:hypothetical protein n=1 Tax=Enterobacter roggenkampii TaxID=1812935 RepID=UPI001FD7B7EB|nr:hypothetical protein [Enterobacter roggenkampii]
MPPVRRAIAAPAAERDLHIQLLLAKYNRNKSNGMVWDSLAQSVSRCWPPCRITTEG